MWGRLREHSTVVHDKSGAELRLKGRKETIPFEKLDGMEVFGIQLKKKEEACTATPSFNKNKQKKKKNDPKERENLDSDEDSSSDNETGFLIRKLPEINVSSSSDEDYSDSVQIEHCYTNEKPNKRLKPTPQSTEIVGEIKNREGDVRPIRILLDTGTSATIVLKRYVMRGSQRVSRNQKTKWTTMGGSFVTTQQRLLEFRFPEFHHHKTIEWTCHVDTKTDPREAQYDMIVGTDLMNGTN